MTRGGLAVIMFHLYGKDFGVECSEKSYAHTLS